VSTTEKPISNNAGRGRNSGAGPKRVLERMSTPGGPHVDPKATPINIASNSGGRGSAGRKGYPKLGGQ